MSTEPNDAAATWNEHAATWDDREEAHTYASQAFATLEPVVRAHLGSWGELRVLDFGAGTGLLTAKLAPLCREVAALDIAPKMVEMLERKVELQAWSNVQCLAGELASLAPSHAELQAPFDLIVASSVCSFLPDFAAELERLRALLRPGGLFVHWDWHGDVGDWASGFTREQVQAAYASAGLEAVSAELGFVFHFDGKDLEVLMGVARR